MLKIHLKASICPCRFLPVAWNTGSCVGGRKQLGILIEQACVLCYLHRLRGPDPRIQWLHCALWKSISDELLPGFTTVAGLWQSPLHFDISMLSLLSIGPENALVELQAKFFLTLVHTGLRGLCITLMPSVWCLTLRTVKKWWHLGWILQGCQRPHWAVP